MSGAKATGSPARYRHDVRVGTVITLELPGDSPMLSMPWIITFGPEDDVEWDAVVCGPYEREHALALAAEIAADQDDLTAVVEPLLPLVEVDRIREEIAVARALADEEEDSDQDTDLAVDLDDEDEYDEEDGGDEDEEDEDGEEYDEDEDDYDEEYDEDEEEHDHPRAPSPEEIRAGFARIAARLTGN